MSTYKVLAEHKKNILKLSSTLYYIQNSELKTPFLVADDDDQVKEMDLVRSLTYTTDLP